MYNGQKFQWNDICNRNDSCALSGAAAWAAGIKNSQILVNGPLWCYFYAMRLLEFNDVELSERMHMTQLDNTAIVYGSEKCIQEGVERVLANGKPDLFFIENNCSAGLIGDDLLGIVRSLKLDMPCIAMDGGGTIGGFSEGYSKASLKGMELFANKKTCVQQPLTVNLLGMTRYYLNGRADFEEVVRLLTNAGYKVNCMDSVDALSKAGEASLNIVCHEELGLALAEYLHKIYGTEFIAPGLPYGCEGTKDWLLAIDEQLPAPNLDLVLEEIQAMDNYLNKKNSDMRILWDILAFDRILMAGPATTVQCMANALRKEWLDTDELTLICQHKLKHNFCVVEDKLFYAEEGGYSLKEMYHNVDNESVLSLASSNEYMELRQLGLKRLARCHITSPSQDVVLLNNVPFMGIKGAANMQQILWNSFVEMKLRQ